MEGDFGHNGTLNVLDITNGYVKRLFQGGAPAFCPDESNYNDDGSISNILDLLAVVARLFQGAPFAPCP